MQEYSWYYECLDIYYLSLLHPNILYLTSFNFTRSCLIVLHISISYQTTLQIQTLIVSTVLLHFPTVPTVIVTKLLHSPIHSHQTSQIQFSPISGEGINWSVCRSNSLGTSHSRQGWDDSSSSFTARLHYTVLHSTIYRCTVHCDKYFY